ncbi:MAG: cold-shock protein [Candidatus Marinimicrobia bacterium]|nr:cold-shock protein [Candidatus Neomarinimicrobiota bacterium]|tara:strand:+ start:431 stop:631 length:201 start_codon:yes stop_codon:yes gene_type:complete
MLKGKIKHLDTSNGWGFIETIDGDDYFFNVSNVRPGQNLNLGDSVKFDFYQTNRGPSAKNILKIDS